MGKQNMPSIVQSHFLNEVAPSDLADICHVNVEGEVIGHDFCDEMKIMLICAYIELILPLFSLVGSFLFRKEAAHVLGANLPALCSVITGSLFLALNYKSGPTRVVQSSCRNGDGCVGDWCSMHVSNGTLIHWRTRMWLML